MDGSVNKPAHIEEVQNKPEYWGGKTHSNSLSYSKKEEIKFDSSEHGKLLMGLPVLELDTLLQRIDYDKETTKELLDLFLIEAETVINLLTVEHLKNDAVETVAFNAHKLKGLTKDIGAEQIGYLALQLEIKAHQGFIPEAEMVSSELFNCYEVLKQKIILWQVEHSN